MILDVQPNAAGSPSPSKLPELLVLTHRIPFPPDRGDRIRSWNIIQHLSKRANISLACVTSEPIDTRASEALRKVCCRVAIAPVGKSARWIKAGAKLVSGRSMTEGLFWSSRLAKTLDHWADTLKFDSVLVYCSSMMPYVYRKRLSHIPRVVDLVDVDSQKWRDYAARSPKWKKLLYRAEASRVQSLEKKIIESSEAVMLASDAEADLLRDQNEQKDGATIYGITNGVDVNFFDPSSIHPSLIPSRPQSAVSTSSLRLVFVGVLDYLPNIDGLQWFVANVWPKLKERVPSTTLEVIGRHPTPAVQKLGRVEGSTSWVRSTTFDLIFWDPMLSSRRFRSPEAFRTKSWKQWLWRNRWWRLHWLLKESTPSPISIS